MTNYIISDSSLNHRIRITYWEEFKCVCNTIKEVSAEIRKDYKRKSKDFVSLIAVAPIKAIAHKMYLMFRYSYRDDALFLLLSDVIKKLNILIRTIRNVHQTKYLDTLEKVSSLLIGFLGDNQSIQLELFDPQTYHDPNGAKRQMPCFVRWCKDRLREFGFSNPYKNCGQIALTQLSIPFEKAKLEAAKNRYLPAYFDIVPEIEETAQTSDSEQVEEIAKLGLRTLRQVARFLGLPQKVDGKDCSKADFVTVLEKLSKKDQSKVSEALAAINW